MVAPSALQDAIAAWQAGDTARAEKAARRAVRQTPDTLPALQILGACAAGRAAWPDAVKWFSRAATLRPADAGIQFNLAEALREGGDMAGAEAALRAALDSDADHVPALVTLARLRATGGVLGEALALLDRAIARAPRDARARLARGEVRTALGRTDAIDDLREACALAPDFAYAQFALGSALANAGNNAAADASLSRAVALDPKLTAAHARRGMLAMLRIDPETALTHYDAALAGDPRDAQSLALKGEALRDLRRFDEARKSVARALEIEPANAMARLVSAQLDFVGGDAAAARAQFEALLADNPPTHIAVEAEARLGEALDRLGEYRPAFRHFATANERAARNIPDASERTRLPARIEAVGRTGIAAPPQKLSADGLPSPVFLVGFPRSGTTLTEQILAAHGAFVTSDEAPLIDRTLRKLDPTGHDPTRGLGALADSDLAGLRAEYRAQAEAMLPAYNGDKLLLDKLPWNLIELPFIARLFPDAKVIVSLRDPRDACLSAFMQYFQLNPATLHLLTLDDTVAIYEAMMGLWAAWRGTCPLEAHELRYEDLVDDFDGTVQGLLEFLGLEWRDAIRNFPETAAGRVIRTPSRDAVASPVNRDALGRWRHYEAELAPYRERLAPFVELFGYAPD